MAAAAEPEILTCHWRLMSVSLQSVATAVYVASMIKSCRRALTRITAATVVNSLIVTRLDYCNSLLAGCTKHSGVKSQHHRPYICWKASVGACCGHGVLTPSGKQRIVNMLVGWRFVSLPFSMRHQNHLYYYHTMTTVHIHICCCSKSEIILF